MADISSLSDATLEQLASGTMPDVSKLSESELEYLAANPPKLAPADVGNVEAAGRAFVNNLPLGGQIGALGTEALSNTPKGYSSSLEEWNKKAEDAKAANPVAYGTGAVAGAVAPALIPGVGQLGIAGNAALGAAYGLGNTDLTKDPMNIAKDAAVGSVVGGVAGKMGEMLKGAAPGLEEAASRKAVKTFGMNPKMLGNLSEEEYVGMGKFARDSGLVHGDTLSRVTEGTALKEKLGQQIDVISKEAKPLQDVSPFVARLDEEAQKTAEVFGGTNNADLDLYRTAIANLQKGDMTYPKLQQLKELFAAKAFNDAHIEVNPAAGNVWRVIKDAQKAIIAESPEEYQNVLTQYKHIDDMVDGLKSKLGQERAGNTGGGGGMIASQIKKLPGPMRAIVGPLATMMGHPMLGVAAAIPELTNPANHEAVLGAAARALPKASQVMAGGTIDAVTSRLLNRIHTDPKSLGKFSAPLTRAAQTGGSQGLAATHYLLANQYPEYNEMMLKDEANGH